MTIQARKILILGGSGSGKSYLAEKLGSMLNIPVNHLDVLYWKPNWTKPKREDWQKIMDELCREESGIIDGYYESTFLQRLTWCDMVIYLDFPTSVLLWNIVKRYVRVLLGFEKRHTIAPGCNEKLDWLFLHWVATFNKKNRGVIHAYLKESEKNIVILKCRKEVNSFLESFDK